MHKRLLFILKQEQPNRCRKQSGALFPDHEKNSGQKQEAEQHAADPFTQPCTMFFPKRQRTESEKDAPAVQRRDREQIKSSS